MFMKPIGPANSESSYELFSSFIDLKKSTFFGKNVRHLLQSGLFLDFITPRSDQN